MKTLKTWFDTIKDSRAQMADRMYRLLTSVGLIVLLLVTAGAVLIEENITVIVVLAASTIILGIISFITVDQKKIPVGIQLIGTFLTFFILPVGFFSGGGIEGGSPIWFVFCFVFISLMMSGASRTVYLLCAFAVTGSCYYLAHSYPQFVYSHTPYMAYMDSFVSVILMSAIICILIVFQRNALEEQNRLANEQKKEILELNRIQNHFFSSLSHEIRTPINTIIGLNELTLRENISDTVADNSLNIQGASNMLLALINDVLDMSKIESGKMTIIERPYDVGVLLSDIVNMIWSQAKKKDLSFHVEVDPSLPSILSGDEVRIRQILINLLNNAVKYTQKGSVTLSVHSQQTDAGHVSVSWSVSDTGSGIRQESIPHLFSAFERVDEEENRFIEGTGLGLAIVKQLVDLMDGRIAVDSVYTKGTTFVVTIEQGIAGSEAIGNIKLKQHRRTTGKKKDSFIRAQGAYILVVDDNELNLKVAKRLLSRTGAHIDVASGGSAALEATIKTKYNMIFMDHLMPEMDGVETLHALRDQNGGLNTLTPVIALTANAGSDMAALYEREGFDGYLTKPVTGELLEKEVIKFLPPDMVSVPSDEETDASKVYQAPVQRQPRKRLVMISTENICDVPAEILDRYSVKLLSFNIQTEGGVFADGIEMDTDSTLSYIQGNHTAKTVEPGVPEYVHFFAEALENAQQIIHITPNVRSSGAFHKATAASSTLGNVIVYDSGQMSVGIGIMVLFAAKMADSGFGAEEILLKLSELNQRICTSFLLDSTDYLKRNGRIPKHATLVCEAFMLRPAVSPTPEGMRMKKLYPGTKAIARNRYIKDSLRNLAHIDPTRLYLVYCGVPSDELTALEEQIQSRIHFEQIIRRKVSSSSAAMFGPGTIGLVFLKKNSSDAIEQWPREVFEIADSKGLKKESEYRRLTEKTVALPASPMDLKAPVRKKKDDSALPEWLRSLKEPDTYAGILHCGSAEDYLAALKIFYQTIEDRAKEIEHYYNESDYKNYTIKVHALKSSARIIGASKLSSMAEALESAGNNLDYDQIKRETLSLLSEYRKYRQILSGLDSSSDDVPKETVPPEILSDAYHSLLEFADQMDVDLSEMVLDSLTAYQLPEKDDAVVKELRRMLLDLDWNGIKALISGEYL